MSLYETLAKKNINSLEYRGTAIDKQMQLVKQILSTVCCLINSNAIYSMIISLNIINKQLFLAIHFGHKIFQLFDKLTC